MKVENEPGKERKIDPKTINNESKNNDKIKIKTLDQCKTHEPGSTHKDMSIRFWGVKTSRQEGIQERKKATEGFGAHRKDSSEAFN